MNKVNLHKEIVRVAYDLYERIARVEGRDIDNWLEAERIVRALRKIRGEDGKRYVLVNVPVASYAEKGENESEVVESRKR